MSESQQSIDQRYREEVLRARSMTPEEKFLAGEALFKIECERALAEIKAQNPEFSEEDCRRELRRRLELQKRMEWEEVTNRQRQLRGDKPH
jgi:hypothetical protein